MLGVKLRDFQKLFFDKDIGKHAPIDFVDDFHAGIVSAYRSVRRGSVTCNKRRTS